MLESDAGEKCIRIITVLSNWMHCDLAHVHRLCDMSYFVKNRDWGMQQCSMLQIKQWYEQNLDWLRQSEDIFKISGIIKLDKNQRLWYFLINVA